MEFYTKIVNFINSIRDMLTIPTFHIVITSAIQYINFALYFVPKTTIITILGLYISINIISFIWGAWLSVKQGIPFA